MGSNSSVPEAAKKCKPVNFFTWIDANDLSKYYQLQDYEKNTIDNDDPFQDCELDAERKDYKHAFIRKVLDLFYVINIAFLRGLVVSNVLDTFCRSKFPKRLARHIGKTCVYVTRYLVCTLTFELDEKGETIVMRLGRCEQDSFSPEDWKQIYSNFLEKRYDWDDYDYRSRKREVPHIDQCVIDIIKTRFYQNKNFDEYECSMIHSIWDNYVNDGDEDPLESHEGGPHIIHIVSEQEDPSAYFTLEPFCTKDFYYQGKLDRYGFYLHLDDSWSRDHKIHITVLNYHNLCYGVNKMRYWTRMINQSSRIQALQEEENRKEENKEAQKQLQELREFANRM